MVIRNTFGGSVRISEHEEGVNDKLGSGELESFS